MDMPANRWRYILWIKMDKNNKIQLTQSRLMLWGILHWFIYRPVFQPDQSFCNSYLGCLFTCSTFKQMHGLDENITLKVLMSAINAFATWKKGKCHLLSDCVVFLTNSEQSVWQWDLKKYDQSGFAHGLLTLLWSEKIFPYFVSNPGLPVSYSYSPSRRWQSKVWQSRVEISYVCLGML